MNKKKVWLACCIYIVILASITLISYASPDAQVALSPTTVYESNEISYNLSVNNIGGSEIISEIKILIDDFEVTDMVNYLGWDEFFNSSLLRWFSGDIENNVYAIFRFDAKADLVDSDTNKDIEIITIGEDGNETTDTVPITILNDNTAPVIQNNIPYNNGFLRAGIINQNTSADVYDNETGILNVTFTYYNCTNLSNIGTNSTVELECNGINCIDQIDLSGYDQGDELCFSFNALNNALEESIVSGSVGFDATAPEVTLISPTDHSYASDNTIFAFNATDNLAPSLQCQLYIDSNIVEDIVALNGIQTTMTYNFSNVTQGDHQWTVRCIDMVGLKDTALPRDIIVDKTAPNITLVSPNNNSIIGDNVLIDINVDDNYEVDVVGYNTSLNSSNLPEGINKIKVNATDKAGNIAQKTFTFIVDKTKPTLTLISPSDNDTMDVHASFVFNATDNFDNSLNCSLYIDGALHNNFIHNTSSISNISTILPINTYLWKLSCKDDAGNIQESTSRTLYIIDMTGPDITMQDIVRIERGVGYDFDFKVSDPSNVSYVSARFDLEDLSLTKNLDNYSTTLLTDINDLIGYHNITIFSNDTLSNPSTHVDSFELVQGYNMTLLLSPQTAEPQEEIVISGSITLDNGSPVPESEVTLYLPNETVNVSIINDSFSFSFDAPLSEGDFDIIASIVSSDGFDHKRTITLTVKSSENTQPEQESQEVSSYSGSTGGGKSLYCGDGVCTTAGAVNENCNKCPQDCGICPIEPQEEPDVAPQEEFLGGYLIDDEDSELNESEARDATPIGQATGIFDLGSLIVNAFVWIIFIAVIAGLYYYSREKKGKGKDNVDWKGYFK